MYSIISGKFLAGIITIAVIFVSLFLFIGGLGLWLLGVVPGADEVGRLALYLVVSICYVGFWLGLAILASVIFRGVATSALAVLALWILLAFFLPLGAQVAAETLAPMPAAATSEADIEAMVRHQRLKQGVSYVSPIALYTDATSVILDPYRKTTRSLVLMGPLERLSVSRFENPLPLDARALVVAPHLVLLVALTLLCFGVTYATFLRHEIRAI